MFYSCGLVGVLRNMVGCNKVVFPSDKGLQHDVNVARIISPVVCYFNLLHYTTKWPVLVGGLAGCSAAALPVPAAVRTSTTMRPDLQSVATKRGSRLIDCRHRSSFPDNDGQQKKPNLVTS